jgi:3',5'-cyclic AMP phosphodiesterase CpdA
VLLLSDLHVDETTDIDTMYQTLLEDLRSGPSRAQLTALVISGDLTNRATTGEFARANALIQRLVENVPGLSPDNTIVVPGNHDVDWAHPGVYQMHTGGPPPIGLTDDEFVTAGNISVVRDAAAYRESWRNFSRGVYEPLYGRAYPLDPDIQVDLFDLPSVGLCFVTLNSAWNTAKLSPDRAQIVDGAVNEANRRLAEVGGDPLKIAVWHHPITGNEKIVRDAFVERLRNAAVRLCLHGHIHESRADLLGYLHPQRIHVVGTGSFGAPWEDRVESTPRLYQLLEFSDNRTRLRVHTRGLSKTGGAWGPSYEWPDPGHAGKRLDYYDIKLDGGS